MYKKLTFTFKTALSRCCFYITHFTERKIIMDEKITTSATENAESTAQAEQAAATAQSSAQDGTAEKVVTQSEPQSEARSESEHSGSSGAGTVDGEKSDTSGNPDEKSESSKENSEKKIAVLEGKVHALTVGVAADCIDDVLALAQAKVSGDVTLDKAIDSVIEKYPSFKGEKPPKAIITSAVATVNDEQKTADEARINKIMGIK
jgi:hypothetical protein